MLSKTHSRHRMIFCSFVAAVLIPCVFFLLWPLPAAYRTTPAASPAPVHQSTPADQPPEAPLVLPRERVSAGSAQANAPSDGGCAGVSDAELTRFLRRLADLPHYDESRAARYLNYYGSARYTDQQIVRLVNTDNDLIPFTDAVPAAVDAGVLTLVNKYHEMPACEPEDLTPLPGAYASRGELRAPACRAYVAMADAAQEAGCPISCVSPYRSYAQQQSIYNDYVSRHSLALADTYSARPGFSEHQTGLCVDVTAEGAEYTEFDQTAAFRWMTEHAHEYGFILRYGDGMDYITGYIYEPWHYRYVGAEAAAYIHSHDLTFEEYYYYYILDDDTPA